MSEKRFKYVLGDGFTDGFIHLSATEVCELLNEQDEKIKELNKKYDAQRHLYGQLKLDYNYLREVNKETVKQCERWKNLYELKDSEVTARVDALNKVCEYYTSEVLFKSDVDPNKAVREVINEILNTEVEM